VLAWHRAWCSAYRLSEHLRFVLDAALKPVIAAQIERNNTPSKTPGIASYS
jgi:hypothetical protein